LPAVDGLSPGLLRDFNELVVIIERAKAAAYQAVNRELIGMHWNVGGYISERLRTGHWGDAVVKQFSAYVLRRYPGIAGFSLSNIWRMRQFFDATRGTRNSRHWCEESLGATTASSWPGSNTTTPMSITSASAPSAAVFHLPW
jgi:hypothetical protein